MERDANRTSPLNLDSLKAAIISAWDIMSNDFIVSSCQTFRRRWMLSLQQSMEQVPGAADPFGDPMKPSAILAVPIFSEDDSMDPQPLWETSKAGEALLMSDFSPRWMKSPNESLLEDTVQEYLNNSMANLDPNGVVINYWPLLVLSIPIFTALGNILVILSVTTEKVLQTSTNYLIVSLAIADLLVALLVMPWAIYVLHGQEVCVAVNPEDGCVYLRHLHLCDHDQVDLAYIQDVFKCQLSHTRAEVGTVPCEDVQWRFAKANGQLLSHKSLRPLRLLEVFGELGEQGHHRVQGQWTLPFITCDLYIGMDVACSTASIFNLVGISMDRYQAVTQPLKYSQKQQTNDHGRVIKAIVVIWMISMGLGCPIFFGLNAPNSPEETECILYDANFIIFSSTASFFIPCFVILLFYYKIMKAILRQHRGGKSAKKSELVSRPSTEEASQDNLRWPQKWSSRIRRWIRRQRRRRGSSKTGNGQMEMANTKGSPSDEAGGGAPFLLRPGQGGIACTLSHIIRVSTNPLEKQDPGPSDPPGPTAIPVVSIQQPEDSEEMEPTHSKGTQTVCKRRGPPRNLSEPRRSRPGKLRWSAKNAKDDLELTRRARTTENGIDVQSRPRQASLFSSAVSPSSRLQVTLKAATDKGSRRASSANVKEFPISDSGLHSGSSCNKVRCLVPRSPKLLATVQKLQDQQLAKASNPSLSADSKVKSTSLRQLGVTFSLSTPDSEAVEGLPTSPGLDVPKPAFVRSLSSSGTLLATPNGSTCNLVVPGQGHNNTRRPSIGTSIKVLRRAATWKIRSQERLQAKRERRERRATKTLGIVLEDQKA
eukprot:snap_masked-scaffold141_size315519-processed-gene-1.6 protein:Tk03985 transcript:snap_masked-scaffold141_size315519-processed-gene-1.6-mRNA-1 annotation:"GF20567"